MRQVGITLATVLLLGCSGSETEDATTGQGSADATDSGDSDGTSGDGDLTSGDGDLTSGDGDLTSGDGDLTSGDGDATSGDGDDSSGDGDGDGMSGDGDGMSGDGDGMSGDGDGDGMSGDGDGMSGDGDGMSGDGDGMSGDGDGVSGDGDGMSGDGDGMSGDGDEASGDGDGASGDGDGDGDGDGTSGDGDGASGDGDGDGDGDGAVCVTDPFPAALGDTSGLGGGYGQITFAARDANMITAFTYRSTTFDPATGTVLFAMHGSGRDAAGQRDMFAPIAERNGALLIAPEFNAVDYPGSESYTLGVGVNGTPSGASFVSADWREPEDYLYSEIEHVFEAVRASLGIADCEYSIVGHSAGAQFTHRAITFRPDTRARIAVSMNAGWYTLLADAPPVPPGTLDVDALTMPYGLLGTPPTIDRSDTLAQSLVVLLGVADTLTPAEDPDVRGTPEAMAQGANRLERGRFYFDHAQSEAALIPTAFAWRTAEMPGAAHSTREMAQSAGWFLFAPPTAQPCTPTPASAASVTITELAVRPDSDANGDGSVANPDAEDEFIEIVNIGSTDVCLTGWSVGDASDPERHRIAVGPSLAPDQAVVVFGGGLPTGSFAGADVEWAAFSSQLWLRNSGDVVSLRDHQDVLVAQVSWGDCDGSTCAAEHVTGAAQSGVSWTRSSGTGGALVPHDTVSALPYSPGAAPDGMSY